MRLETPGSQNRLLRLAGQIVTLGLRLANAVAKFALAIYMTRYLGLADLGLYGLLVGAATAVPAVFGFGLNDWLARRLVGMTRAQAIPLATTRLAITVIAHIVLQGLGWTVNWWLGAPIPWTLAVPVGTILLLEHLAADAYALLIGRDRAQLANVLLFLRAGFWPFAVIAWGLLDPQAQTLQHVLFGWIAGLCVMWALIAVRFLPEGRWRLLSLRWHMFGEGLRGGWPFYLNDTGAVGNLYIDRFLVSLFLGLELTGVYTFFWSVANVVHTLSVYGIIQPQMPRLVTAARAQDKPAFRKFRRNLQLESLGWALALALAFTAAMLFLLPYLGRPLLQENFAILGIVLLATLLRIGADGFGFVLYALGKDRLIAATSLAGITASAALNTVLVPVAGLWGAGIAYVIVSAALLISRHAFSRMASP